MMITFNNKKVNRNDYVTKNFKYKEFQCKNGNKNVTMDMNLIYKLQELRDILNKPIIITSAYRSLNYNRKIYNYEKDNKGNYKGDNSQHIKGKAVDIKVSGLTPLEIGAYGQALGFNGIGIYNTFTHLDTRSYKARWGNYKGMDKIKVDLRKVDSMITEKRIREIIREEIRPSIKGNVGEWGKVHFNNLNKEIDNFINEYRGNDYIKRAEVFKLLDILLNHLTKEL